MKITYNFCNFLCCCFFHGNLFLFRTVDLPKIKSLSNKNCFLFFCFPFSSQSCCQMKKKVVDVRFANVVQVYNYLFQMCRLFPAMPYHRPLLVKNLPMVQLALTPNPGRIIEGNGYSRGIIASY